MLYLLITFGIILAPLYLFLPPRYKVLLAIFVMTTCFNLTPNFIYGNVVVADIGCIMLMISGVHLVFFAKPKSPPIRARYLTVLMIFTVWLWLALLWGLVVYQYPVLNTLKLSRHTIIGYMSFWVFIRLFRVDSNAFDFLWKSIYWTTFVLLILSTIQCLTNVQILQMSSREYEGVIRRVPNFLPFCLMYFWVISSKYLSGNKAKIHEFIYSIITIFITIMTLIRGVYFTVFIMFLLMAALLFRYNRLSLGRAFGTLCVSTCVFALLFFSGTLDKILSRAVSGLKLITGSELSRKLDDTFTGRMAMVRERFELVVGKNPFFGYAFVHESDVPPDLKTKLQRMHGSVSYTEKLRAKYALGDPYVIAFYSADSGWSDLLIYTGVVGTLIFIGFVISFISDFFRWMRNALIPRYFYIRLGLFLQAISLVFLMTEGTPYITQVQIPAFMIAGYALLTASERNSSHLI